ncbi:Pentatricopeptide repeat (PPR) superfamily protein [Quillaja saponaria]|uniref:Pentatricopeptide repeat (PPR) superfamily protein n=1 Tax=Quillaja saponaria TaxID=32244 RepID=A0AAD7PMY1_QUISA|nr:Pentatricopeptide repeat (PPR) superfamily protein [Quillaja saponaria]
MAIAAVSALPFEGFCCSTSHGITSNWTKPPYDGQRVPALTGTRCKTPVFGSTQFHWLPLGHDLCLSKVCVASDYSDSVPDSSNMSNQGYHHLEDLKVSRKIRQSKLSSAEIARTTVEGNSNALLVFPGTVHCEPHEQISWAEFQYLIDDYGDIFFEIFDDANILEDCGANNPVNALIAMDIPTHENRRVGGEYNILNRDHDDEFPFDDDLFQVIESEVSTNIPLDWGMPDMSSLVHPIYFAKCLTKAVNAEYDKGMDHPSNGISILGCLRPAFADEESYLRRLYHSEDSDGYNSDQKDGEVFLPNIMGDRRNTGLTLYRLEIIKIELFSMYGCQSVISLHEFQDAEPDCLVNSTPAILEHFSRRSRVALKALCKKKGLDVEEASLIGVDSLGMDVRVFSGVEVKTHRFPFKVRATSEVAAEKQIQQLLFPRSRRKRTMNSSCRDA